MLRDMLRQEGTKIGRMHVATLMKRMAIESIYRRPNTSKPAPGHKIHRYLLRKLAIVRPNQVWATDISYIPMAKGFVYLVAIVDWFSRKVLAQEADLGECRSRWRPIFCVEALEEALARFGKPEIFNTNEGRLSFGSCPRHGRRLRFTSQAFNGVLLREKIACRMDGRGAWRENIIVERLWRDGSMNLGTDMARNSGQAKPSVHDAPYRNIEETTGRRSTYPLPITVQTNRATSHDQYCNRIGFRREQRLGRGRKILWWWRGVPPTRDQPTKSPDVF